MFLTTFDKKMYAEALREEGRDEMMEKVEKITVALNDANKRAEEEKRRAEQSEMEVARLRQELAQLKQEK